MIASAFFVSYMQITDLQEKIKIRDLKIEDLKKQLQKCQQNPWTSAHGKASYVCDCAVVVQ